jgi:hypothetical protein
MSGANVKEGKSNSKARALMYSLLGGVYSLVGLAYLPSFLVSTCSDQNGTLVPAGQISPCLFAMLFVLVYVGCAVIFLFKIVEAISEIDWI